eukprot:2569288-Pyramimonas_sp.AAC.1
MASRATTGTGAAQEDDGEGHGDAPGHAHRIRAAKMSDDPRRKREAILERVATEHLKDAPTLPAVSANGHALGDGVREPAGA